MKDKDRRPRYDVQKAAEQAVIEGRFNPEIQVEIPMAAAQQFALLMDVVIGRGMVVPMGRPLFPEEYTIVYEGPAITQAPKEVAAQEGVFGIIAAKLPPYDLNKKEDADMVPFKVRYTEVHAIIEAAKEWHNLYLIDIWEFLPGERVGIERTYTMILDFLDRFVANGGKIHPKLRKEVEVVDRMNRILMGKGRPGEKLDFI